LFYSGCTFGRETRDRRQDRRLLRNLRALFLFASFGALFLSPALVKAGDIYLAGPFAARMTPERAAVIITITVLFLIVRAVFSYARFSELKDEYEGKFRFFVAVSTLSFEKDQVHYRVRARTGLKKPRALASRLTVECFQPSSVEMLIVPSMATAKLNIDNTALQRVDSGDRVFENKLKLFTTDELRAKVLFQDEAVRKSLLEVFKQEYALVRVNEDKVEAIKFFYQVKDLGLDNINKVTRAISILKAPLESEAKAILEKTAAVAPASTAPHAAIAASLGKRSELGIKEIEDLVAEGKRLYDEGEYQKSCETYKQVLDVNPQNPSASHGIVKAAIKAGNKELRDTYAAVLARSFVKLNRMKDLLELYKLLKTSGPDGVLASKEQWALANWLNEEARFQESVKAYYDFGVQYPDNPQAPTALFRSAEILAKRCEQHEKARQLFQYVTQKYPDSLMAKQVDAAMQRLNIAPAEAT